MSPDPDLLSPQVMHMRITHLEEWRGEIRAMLTAMDGKLTAIQQQLDRTPHCPAPGSCLQLRDALSRVEAQMERHERRLSVLERVFWTASGAGTLLWGAAQLFG